MVNLAFDASVFARAIEGFGKDVTYTPVTQTLTNFGDEILTDGTPVVIEAAFYTNKDEFVQDKPALILNADAIVIVYPDQDIRKNDKVTFDGITYRVQDDIFKRLLGRTVFYKVARLKQID